MSGTGDGWTQVGCQVSGHAAEFRQGHQTM